MFYDLIMVVPLVHAVCKIDQIVYFKQVHYKTFRCILFCAHNKIKKKNKCTLKLLSWFRDK